jgi:hypothetical protein
MDMCIVNGRRRDLSAGLKTWKQLLVSLEEGAGRHRIVVTAVRFAGVNQPAFRDDAVQATRLAGLEPIDIKTTTVGELVASAADTVIDGLERLRRAARGTADAFRHHDLSRAHCALARLVGTFQLLTRLTGLVDEIDCDAAQRSTKREAFLRRLHERLEQLIFLDMREDWISVAEVLEFDIAELLPEWVALLRDVDSDVAAMRSAS